MAGLLGSRMGGGRPKGRAGSVGRWLAGSVSLAPLRDASDPCWFCGGVSLAPLRGVGVAGCVDGRPACWAAGWVVGDRRAMLVQWVAGWLEVRH